MITAFEKYKIDYDITNYFVKKAVIVFNDIYNSILNDEEK